MSRCGCTTFPTCSCILTGDNVTAGIYYGNGTGLGPYLPNIKGYPFSRPHGAVQRSSSTALADGVDSTITWTVNGSIPTTMWNSGIPTRVTVPQTGTYMLTASCNDYFNTSTGWGSSNADQKSLSLSFKKNGATIIAGASQPANQPPAAFGDFSLITVTRLTANDYIELIANQKGQIGASTAPTLLMASMEVRWMGL